MTSDTKLKIWVYGICYSVGILLCVLGALIVGAFDSADLIHLKCPQATAHKSSYLQFEERSDDRAEVGALVCDSCEYEIKIVPNLNSKTYRMVICDREELSRDNEEQEAGR